MVVIRWSWSGFRIFHWQFSISHYYYWYSRCITNLQNWTAMFVALRGWSTMHTKSHGLHPHSTQSFMAHLWRTLVVPNASVIWDITLHYYHWHTFRQTAFQNGRPLLSSIRKRSRIAFLIKRNRQSLPRNTQRLALNNKGVKNSPHTLKIYITSFFI